MSTPLLLHTYQHVPVCFKEIFNMKKIVIFLQGPDYAKGHLCKHIIFVLHRVLKVDRNSSLLYQQALLTNELNEIFSKADEQNNDPEILAEQPVRIHIYIYIFIFLILCFYLIDS